MNNVQRIPVPVPVPVLVLGMHNLGEVAKEVQEMKRGLCVEDKQHAVVHVADVVSGCWCVRIPQSIGVVALEEAEQEQVEAEEEEADASTQHVLVMSHTLSIHNPNPKLMLCQSQPL
jgi:hypothetical protein